MGSLYAKLFLITITDQNGFKNARRTLKIFKKLILQWKPLNVIALVRSQSDNINRMITIAEVVDKLQNMTLLFKSKSICMRP